MRKIFALAIFGWFVAALTASGAFALDNATASKAKQLGGRMQQASKDCKPDAYDAAQAAFQTLIKGAKPGDQSTLQAQKDFIEGNSPRCPVTAATGMGKRWEVSIGASLGGASTCNDQINFLTLTGFPPSPDLTSNASRSACGSGVVGGGRIGFEWANPLRMGWGPHDPTVGFEFEGMGFSGGSTLQGTPVIPPAFPPLVTAAATDSYSNTNNYLLLLNGTVNIPLNSNLTLLTGAGGAWLNQTNKWNCAGTCTTAGATPFVGSVDTTFSGFDALAGLRWEFKYGLTPIYFDVVYNYVHLSAQTLNFGVPGAAVTYSTQPNVNMVRVRMGWELDFASSIMSDYISRGIAQSDIRLKHDVVRVGQLDNGLGLYRFKYNTGDAREYVGVIAQEVADVVPDAVVKGDDGYLKVDYAKLGIRMETWDVYQWKHTAATPQQSWTPMAPRAYAMQRAALEQRSCAMPPDQDFSEVVAAIQDVLPVNRSKG